MDIKRKNNESIEIQDEGQILEIYLEDDEIIFSFDEGKNSTYGEFIFTRDNPLYASFERALGDKDTLECESIYNCVKYRYDDDTANLLTITRIRDDIVLDIYLDSLDDEGEVPDATVVIDKNRESSKVYVELFNSLMSCEIEEKAKTKAKVRENSTTNKH